MSIDTEGNEFQILKSIDFNHLPIKVIVVENNYSQPEISDFLSKFNYKRIIRLSCDEIYIRKEFISMGMRFRLTLFKIIRRIHFHKLGFRKRFGKWFR